MAPTLPAQPGEVVNSFRFGCMEGGSKPLTCSASGPVTRLMAALKELSACSLYAWG